MAGFNPSKDQSNADYTGKLRTFSVDATHATALASGDVIVLTGTSDADGFSGADAAAAGSAFTAIIAGVDPVYVGEQLNLTGLPALTAGTIKCSIDDNMLYEAEVSGGALVADDIGLNADILATAATTTGGLIRSNMTIDSTTKLSTATLQFRLVQLLPNDQGVIDGLRVLVRPNNTTNKPGAAGV